MSLPRSFLPRLFLFVGLVCLGLSSLLAQDSSLGALASLGPRYEGSASLDASLDLIEEGLKSAGLSPHRFSSEGSPGAHSFSSNIEAVLPGKRPDRLYIVIPVDNYPGEGSDKGRGGIILGLGAAQVLARQAKEGGGLPISISFVFLGSEHRWRRGEDRSGGLGSWALIRQSQSLPTRAFLYLEADSVRPSFSLVNTSQALLSPYWIYDRARLSLEKAGISYRVDANLMQVHRLGLGDIQGPLGPFLSSGLPAVELLNVSGPGEPISLSEENAGIRSFAVFLTALGAANSGGFEDLWDRNYLSFQILGRSIVIREKPYVASIIGLSALVLLILIALSIRRRQATKALLSRWPAILGQTSVIFLVAAGLFLSGRLITGLEAGIFGSQDFWLSSPGLFLLLRLGSAFFLFLAAILILVNLRILSSSPMFYEFAALGLLFADYFIYSAILPPFIFYFAWAMPFVGLSLGLRKSHWTLVCYGLMYLPFILLASTILQNPELALNRSFIMPGLAEALFAAAWSLPFFVFTASPLLIFVKPTRRARRIAGGVFLLLALGLETGGVVYTLKASPGALRSLQLRETLDQDKGVFEASLSDRRRLGRLVVHRDGQALSLASLSDRAELKGEDSRTYVSLSQKRTDFLGRSLLDLMLDFSQAPYFVELALTSAQDIALFDCSLPYEVALDGKSARIFVGAGLPTPLKVQLTVSADTKARLDLTASYLAPLVAWDLGRGLGLGKVDQGLKASWQLQAGGGK